MTLAQIIKPFYEIIPTFTKNLDSLKPGQIVWAPVSYFESVPYVLEAERAAPPDHDIVNFSLKQLRATHFSRKHSALPVTALPRRDNEEWLAARAKKRPCVVVALVKSTRHSETIAREMGSGRKHWDCQNLYLVPLYSIDDREGGNKFPKEFVARIQAMEYEHFFFLPAFAGTKKSFRQAIGRFDRMFPAPSHHLSLEPTEQVLVEDAYNVFSTQLCKYLGFELHPELVENYEVFRELVKGGIVITPPGLH